MRFPRLFGPRPATEEPGAGGSGLADLPRPLRRTYVVGDIHGRHDLLERMLALVAEDAAGAGRDLVFLGDYVDRGPDSAAVLRRLAALDRAEDGVTCLLGNHDRMLLDVLEAPDLHETRWLAIGGDATLTSFAVPPHPAPGAAPEARGASARAAALAAALGEGLRDWLRARPLWWASGSLVAVHALTDPGLAMAAQDPETLLWARPGRDLAPRADGRWVAHGHTIVAAPALRAGHIALDTGAYRTGRLTALVADPQAPPRFLQT